MLWWKLHVTPPIAGIHTPAPDGARISLDSGETWAMWTGRSLFDPVVDDLVARNTSQGKPLVVHSCLIATPTDEDGVQDAPWRTWGAQAKVRLAARLAELAARVESAGGTLLVVPTWNGVISDIPTTVQFLKERPSERLGLVLEPASMLAPSMLPNLPDHLARLYGAAAMLPGVEGVIVSNLRQGEDGEVEVCEAERGLIGDGLLSPMVRQARAATPALRWVVRTDAPGDPSWLSA